MIKIKISLLRDSFWVCFHLNQRIRGSVFLLNKEKTNHLKIHCLTDRWMGENFEVIDAYSDVNQMWLHIHVGQKPNAPPEHHPSLEFLSIFFYNSFYLISC